ncbi:hypothetical protein Emag_003260 [Eimeria magna]
MRDEDLLTMNLDPQTGAPAPGTADLGASMFWGQTPPLPMGAPPGASPMVGRGPYGPAPVGGGPRMGQGGGPQMAVAPPAMGYGMGASSQQAVGAPRSPTFSPMPPGTRNAAAIAAAARRNSFAAAEAGSLAAAPSVQQRF